MTPVIHKILVEVEVPVEAAVDPVNLLPSAIVVQLPTRVLILRGLPPSLPMVIREVEGAGDSVVGGTERLG